MKHFILKIIFLLLYSSSAIAQNDGIERIGDCLEGSEHPYAITCITSERNFVTIHSDSLINNVHIIIKDDKGNVMYNEVTTLQPAPNTIYIPEEYDNEKYSIEIFYDEKHLIGKFEE